MDLKLNHLRERNTADLKIYSQLVHLKKHMRIKKYFFEIHESALDSVDITICKLQHSTILILKFGKLVRIEYIDKDVYLEHKENKNIQKFIVFSTCPLFIT